jgi:hypothetical protein
MCLHRVDLPKFIHRKLYRLQAKAVQMSLRYKFYRMSTYIWFDTCFRYRILKVLLISHNHHNSTNRWQLPATLTRFALINWSNYIGVLIFLGIYNRWCVSRWRQQYTSTYDRVCWTWSWNGVQISLSWSLLFIWWYTCIDLYLYRLSKRSVRWWLKYSKDWKQTISMKSKLSLNSIHRNHLNLSNRHWY